MIVTTTIMKEVSMTTMKMISGGEDLSVQSKYVPAEVTFGN